MTAREILKRYLREKISVFNGAKLEYGYMTTYSAKKLAKIEIKRYYKGKEQKELLEELKNIEI